MEQSHPTFLSRETREDIQFYQTWIDEVLRKTKDEYLQQAYEDLEKIDESVAADLGVSVQLGSLKDAWRKKMNERTQEIVEEFQKNIFQKRLFRVGIVTDGEVYEVDGVTVDETGAIVPKIAGGIYSGHIEEVMFDR